MNPCLQTSILVIDTYSSTTPTNPYTCVAMPYAAERIFYSDFGSKIYESGYTTGGTGSFTSLTTTDIWINDNGQNGPMLRSAVWASGSTYFSLPWLPINTWIGFSYCLNPVELKTYYVGMAGDNATMLKLNGEIVVKQTSYVPPTSNFRFWHIYPITVYPGNNVLEMLGYNVGNVAGFGFEIYDNTLEEIINATSIDDLNVIFNTIDNDGNIFDLVYDDNLLPTTSGYTCDCGSEFVYESCSNRFISLSSVTIDVCLVTNEIISSAVSYYRELLPNDVSMIGYGFKSYNRYLSTQKSLNFSIINPDYVINIPPLIIHDNVEIITDVIYITTTEIIIADPTVFSNTGSTINVITTYTTSPCPLEPYQSQLFLWPNTIMGGYAFQAHYKYPPSIGCNSDPRVATGTCDPPTVGIICIDNIDNTIVGLTAHVSLFVNLTYTSFRDPDGIAQNAYDIVIIKLFDGAVIGKVKRYFPDSLTNPDQNIGIGLIALKPEVFDPLTSFNQFGISNNGNYFDFATTLELDTYLQPGLRVYSVGTGTYIKGLSNYELEVIGINISMVGYPQSNQQIDSFATYNDCFSVVKSASTLTQGTICELAFKTSDLGSAVVAEINGVKKIVGVVIMLTNAPLQGGQCTYDGQGIAMRIDKIASYMNISPYLGQNVNFSDIDNPVTICEPSLSSEACKDINGETFCQIGMCYPTIPTNSKHIKNCTTDCVLEIDFLDQNVTYGKYYRLIFEDYLPYPAFDRCYLIVSASTEMPELTISFRPENQTISGPPILGPFDTCEECMDPCITYDIQIDSVYSSVLQFSAVGNTDPNKNNKIFAFYVDCDTLTNQSISYSSVGYYPSQFCHKLGPTGVTPYAGYYANDNLFIMDFGANPPSQAILINTSIPC